MHRWAIRLGAVAAAAALPWLGLMGAAAVMLALPAAAECIRTTSERYTGVAACAAMGVSAIFAFPGAAGVVAAVWCAAALGMILIHTSAGVRRGMAWAVLAAALACGVVVWLRQTVEGDLFEAAAWALVNWIDAQPNRLDILVQAYQMGYASIGEDVSQIPMLRVLGSVLMTPEMQKELLYSLRTTLTLALEQSVPTMTVLWMTAVGVSAAWIPDVLRRKQGRQPVLPAFGEWRLSQEHARGVLLLFAGYLMPLFSSDPVVVHMGAMCSAAYQYVYMLMGMAAMEGLTKMIGMRKTSRRVMTIALALMAPFVVFLFGLLDQMMDFRHPRRQTDDDEGGYDL